MSQVLVSLSNDFKMVACIDLILAVVGALIPNNNKNPVFSQYVFLSQYSLVAAFVLSGVFNLIAAFTQNKIVIKISKIISFIKTLVCYLWSALWFVLGIILSIMDLINVKVPDRVPVLIMATFVAVFAFEIYFATTIRKRYFAQFIDNEKKSNEQEQDDLNV